MEKRKHIEMVAIFVDLDSEDTPKPLRNIIDAMATVTPLEYSGARFYVGLSPLKMLGELCESNIHTMRRLMTCPLSKPEASEVFGGSAWDITEYVRYFS